MNLTPDEERALVERLRRGDGRAFNELVRQHQSTVYTLVLRLLSNRREDALDVSQEVFVTVFRAIADFRGDSRLSTWIHRIAVNHCRNRIKYLGRRQERRHDAFEEKHEGGSVPLAGVVPPLRGEMPGPEQVYEGNEAERFVAAALDALDPEHREIVVLRELEGLPYEEIVEITGLKIGTVKSRLFRGRAALESAYLAFREGKGSTRDASDKAKGEGPR